MLIILEKCIVDTVEHHVYLVTVQDLAQCQGNHNVNVLMIHRSESVKEKKGREKIERCSGLCQQYCIVILYSPH